MYNSPDHHNVLPFSFRVKMFALALVNFAALIACEAVIVQKLLPMWLRGEKGERRYSGADEGVLLRAESGSVFDGSSSVRLYGHGYTSHTV